ncbi:MAG: hypothetical protein ACYTF7_09985 [Planctomycetota bacterium]|jgi:hypothetical protein
MDMRDYMVRGEILGSWSEACMLTRRLLLCALCGLSVLLWAGGAMASGPIKLFAPDAAGDDAFGYSISVSGDTLLVGAIGDDDNGSGSGSAYVYRWSGGGWVFEAKLTASDGASGDAFGSAVAMDGGTALIGAQYTDGGGALSGSAYVFVRSGTTWTEQAKLMASDAALGDQFGEAVALDGDTALVGAFDDDDAAGADQGSAYVFVRSGSTWTQQAKLLASDAASSDLFGRSVSLDGGTALIGAQRDDDAGLSSGSAYVFVRSGTTWSEQAKLTASDGAAGDYFGRSVALDGETALVGAQYGGGGASADQGSAYVFVRTGTSWTEQAKLTAGDGDLDDYFGYSVALDGDTALIGAWGDDDAGSRSGSAYVFVRIDGSWTEQTKLADSEGGTDDFFSASVVLEGDMVFIGASGDNDAGGFGQGSAHVFERLGSVWVGAELKVFASDAAVIDWFGHSVALDGDTALIGAYGDDDAGLSSGSVYVFVRSGTSWIEQVKLVASDGASSDYFGYSVALDGDTALIGAYGDDDGGSDSGSAYVFVRSGTTWTEQDKLTSSDAAASDLFGRSVALDGDTALVGAREDDDGGSSSGSAYVFVRSGATWTEQDKLTASDAATFDAFGASVALDGDTALVGASGDDDDGSSSGSAYVFVRSGSTWTEQAKLTASDAALSAFFGVSASLEGDTALIGASGANHGGLSSGSAYVFVRSGTTWSEQAKLGPSDGGVNDYFGYSVSLSGNTALIGARGDDEVAGSNQGSAYSFIRTGATWTQRAKLVDSDGAENDVFGYSVALSDGTALVGAVQDDDAAGSSQGSAWFSSVHPESLPALVHNTTLDSLHGSLSDAINGAGSSNVLEASAPAFWAASPVNYLGKLLEINATTRVRQPYHNAITLSDGSSLNAAESITFYGEITNQGGHNATLRAQTMFVGSGGVVDNFPNASLYAQIGETTVGGALNSFAGSTLSFSGKLKIEGDMSMFDATFSGPSLEIERGGRFVGDGTLSTSVINSDAFITVDTTLLTGDLTNNAGAKVTVQIGTLTVLGSLTNNGTIVGDLQTLLRSGTMPGDGFSVGGDYSAGSEASLLMSSDLWRIRVGGDYDVAIDDNNVYDLSQAELNLTGALPSRLEVMSTDIDNFFDGLDRTMAGHFPIGTLRLSGGNTVELVDAHDNDGLGQSEAEALYAMELIVEAGATLHTNGLTIYYETLSMGGTVDDPSNLIQLVECVGDFNGDGFVNGADLGLLLANWGLAGAADLNGDGTTNGADLGLLLAAWGEC